MVLSTENNYYTNIISPVMLLAAPISGLTVKICRFSLDPTIAYSKYIIFNLNTVMIPHKTYIPHIPAFVYLVCFTAKVYCSQIIFMALFSVEFSALLYFIFSVYTNLNFNRMFSVHYKYFCKFSIKNITIWHFDSNFSTPAIFFEEMEPMFVIHNISIATDDDIIQFGNGVNIYTVYLSRTIVIWGNCLN